MNDPISSYQICQSLRQNAKQIWSDTKESEDIQKKWRIILDICWEKFDDPVTVTYLAVALVGGLYEGRREKKEDTRLWLIHELYVDVCEYWISEWGEKAVEHIFDDRQIWFQRKIHDIIDLHFKYYDSS